MNSRVKQSMITGLKILSAHTLLFLVLILFVGKNENTFAAAGNTGVISGRVIDQESGEALPGAVAQIKLPNNTVGAQSDLDGNYLIRDVPEGIYDLLISLAGYSKTRIEKIEVKADQVTTINLVLKVEVYEDREQIVTARPIQNNEAILIEQRKKAASIGNAISAEAMTNTGAGNAGEAIAKIAGGSERAGKYANLRGLEERYISTHLNGVELASSDPDKKSFHMDLIPANLLDNVQVIKSFTPDMPGNFSGGIIDIGTKTYPGRLTMKATFSSTYNSQTTFNEKFLVDQEGGSNWKGMDDGSRNIPGNISSSEVPLYSYAINNAEIAHQLSDLTKSFNNSMSPTSRAAPLNSEYSFSIGDQTTFLGKKLGFLGSFNYRRDYRFYEDGRLAYYFVSGNPQTVTSLTNDWQMRDSRGIDEVLWGGLLTTSWYMHHNHELSLNYVHSQGGTNEARYIAGHFFDGNLPPEATYETRVLRYTERTLNSLQLKGRHQLPGLYKSHLEWNTSYSKNRQNEPDMRFFSNHYYVDTETGDTSYYISPNLYTLPQRFYRDLEEDNTSFEAKWSIPFKQWGGQTGKFSLGGLLSRKNRDFRETVYNFKNPANKYEYNGNPTDFFSHTNMGIYDSIYNALNDSWKYIWTLYMYDNSDPRANYNGKEKVSAFFGMSDLPLSGSLRIIGGLRFETTALTVAPLDSNYAGGDINTVDLLPSVNLVYALSHKMNLRTAYGRTLARPTFREMAPYPSWDFANEFYFIGNPGLKRTLIDNFDLRWEYFWQTGEILAVSLFNKKFKNPIECAIKHENGEIQYQNVDKATVYGAEIEFRRNLSFITNGLKNLTISTNFTLLHSKVDIPDDELAIIRSYDPGAGDSRPLQGQSPYILNIDLTHDNAKTMTMASLSFNVFGARLHEVSQGATPSVYEQSRPELNFIFRQGIFTHLDFKLSIKNIFDPAHKYVQHFRGEDYIKMENRNGRSVSLGLSYNI